MENSEFEEKEYEGPLNTQLLFNNHIYWPPGQVFEKHFGIDSALNAYDPNFWLLFGLVEPKNGVVLDHFNWGYIWKKINRKKQLPTFKLNLFVQAKRPTYLYGKNSEYARKGIKGPYYRFEVMKHQQEALERLAKKLSNSALVVYACPVFHTNSDLYKHIHNRTLVDNSTFVRAIRMKNHGKWVYDEAGTTGLACSEIERIEDEPLSEIIREMIETSSLEDITTEKALENLLFIESVILKEFNEIKSTNVLASEFFRRDNLLSEKDDIFNEPEIRAYVRIVQATRLLNVTWHVFG